MNDTKGPLPPSSPSSTGHARWARVLTPVGVVALAFGGFAVAQAATGGPGNDSARDVAERGTTTTSTSLPDHAASTTAQGPNATVGLAITSVDLPDGATRTFAAGAAGSVTISRNGATLMGVSVSANPGWTPAVDAASGPEVEVEFAGATTRIDLEAELEDGAVHVRERERVFGDDDEAAPQVEDGPGSANEGPGSVNSGRDGTDDRTDDGTDDGPGHDTNDDRSGADGSDSSGPSGPSSADDSGSNRGSSSETNGETSGSDSGHSGGHDDSHDD